MRRNWGIVVCTVLGLIAFIGVLLFVQPPDFPRSVSPTINQIVSSAVLVQTSSGSGSGTLISRGGVCFVLTAGHVVQDTAPPYTVVLPLVANNKIVDHAAYQTELVAYSDPDEGDDVAVLRVLYSGLCDKAMPFRYAVNLPVGTSLMHVGSFLGEDGINSYSTGVLSFIGRDIDGKAYDQETCTAFPGSSGGGVYTTDGAYVGMLVRGASETYTLYTPVRRLLTWADSAGMSFLFNPDLPVPSLPVITLDVPAPSLLDEEPIIIPAVPGNNSN